MLLYLNLIVIIHQLSCSVLCIGNKIMRVFLLLFYNLLRPYYFIYLLCC
jgi:hypothetical protein